MKIVNEAIKTVVKHECDVFVGGGGFAGIAAALSAARAGKKVILVEKSYYLGGFDYNVTYSFVESGSNTSAQVLSI